MFKLPKTCKIDFILLDYTHYAFYKYYDIYNVFTALFRGAMEFMLQVNLYKVD